MITVNGEPLDPELLQETFQRIKSTEEALSKASCCERDEEFQKQAEEEVIESVLLSQEAERTVPDPPPEEVRTALEDTLREWRSHGASWDLLEKQRDSLRADVVARIRMDRYIESVWDSLPALTDDDHRSWYDGHSDEFRTTARAHALHLIRFPGNRPAEDHREMCRLRGLVLDGADFATTAREHTAKEDKDIDLGWIEHERLLNPFETMLFSLREKELSPVFFYENSLHLIWVKKLEPERIPAFEEVADEVAVRALNSQRRKALADIANELRKTAEIRREEEA